MVSEDVIVEGLREVYDPELHYNIYDLGLVYDIDVKDGDVKIIMTLTTPTCPIGPKVTEQINESIGLIPAAKNDAEELTFDPPWTPGQLSDEARGAIALLRHDMTLRCIVFCAI